MVSNYTTGEDNCSSSYSCMGWHISVIEESSERRLSILERQFLMNIEADLNRRFMSTSITLKNLGCITT